MGEEQVGLYLLLFFPFFCATFLFIMNRIFYRQRLLSIQTHRVQVERIHSVESSYSTEPIQVERIYSTEPLQVAEPFQGTLDPGETIQVAEILPLESLPPPTSP